MLRNFLAMRFALSALPSKIESQEKVELKKEKKEEEEDMKAEIEEQEVVEIEVEIEKQEEVETEVEIEEEEELPEWMWDEERSSLPVRQDVWSYSASVSDDVLFCKICHQPFLSKRI